MLATALMGTLLASILIAAGRVRAQGGRANRRIEACEIAEELLAKWWSDPDEFPRSARGTVPGQTGWTWRTRTVDSKDAEKLNASVVAIEVFGPGSGGTDEDRPAVCVEVLLPKQGHKEN